MMKAWFAVVAWLLASGVHAASFDCHKASTRIEKAICADARLGALDDEIAAAYAADRSTLDAAGAARLGRSQREWLKLRPQPPGLAAAMAARLAQLRGIRVTQGGVRFLKLTDDARPMFVLDDVPGASAYNRWVDSVWDAAVGQTTRLPEPADGCPSGDRRDCDADTTARTYATSVPFPGIVSVAETVVTYEQGAAHPEVAYAAHDWWLSRPGRVTADDLFAGKDWRRVIAKAVVAYMKTQDERVRVEPDQLDDVSRIDDWTLTPAALVVRVEAETFNLGRGMAELEIPWKDFGASLRPAIRAGLGLP